MEFNESNIRDFLVALVASGTRPSPSLIKALTKLSGLDQRVVQEIVFEVFPSLKAEVSNPQSNAQPNA